MVAAVAVALLAAEVVALVDSVVAAVTVVACMVREAGLCEVRAVKNPVTLSPNTGLRRLLRRRLRPPQQ